MEENMIESLLPPVLKAKRMTLNTNHAAHARIKYFCNKNMIFLDNSLYLIHSTLSNCIYSQHFFEVQSIPMRKVGQVQTNLIFLPVSQEIAS